MNVDEECDDEDYFIAFYSCLKLKSGLVNMLNKHRFDFFLFCSISSSIFLKIKKILPSLHE